MKVFVYSTILYLFGVAVTLFFRPTLMFRPDGTWKEFGLSSSPDATIFPFWLFCLVWAVFSFFIIYFLINQTPTAAAAVAATASIARSIRNRRVEVSKGDTEGVEEADDDLVQPIAPPRPPRKKKEPKPGYYKLNTEATKKNGTPRYIYVGSELPTSDDESSSENED